MNPDHQFFVTENTFTASRNLSVRRELEACHYEQIRCDNLLAERVAEACLLMREQGLGYAVEQPTPFNGAVTMFNFDSFRVLLRMGSRLVYFDQCMYDLCPPHLPASAGVRIRKSTRLRTNMDSLCKLHLKCDKCHEHFHCLGHVKVQGRGVSVARTAGTYPVKLCLVWSDLVAEALTHRRRAPSPAPVAMATPGRQHSRTGC